MRAPTAWPGLPGRRSRRRDANGETWAAFDDGATVPASVAQAGRRSAVMVRAPRTSDGRNSGGAVCRKSNAGVLVAWSAPLLERFEGVPIKNAALTAEVAPFEANRRSPQPAWKAPRSTRWVPNFEADMGFEIDLQPDLDADALAARLVDRRRTKDRVDLAPERRTQPGRRPPRDATGNRLPTEATAIAGLAVLIPIDGLAPIDRAISTAGGIALDAIDDTGMLLDRPGTWVVVDGRGRPDRRLPDPGVSQHGSPGGSGGRTMGRRAPLTSLRDDLHLSPARRGDVVDSTTGAIADQMVARGPRLNETADFVAAQNAVSGPYLAGLIGQAGRAHDRTVGHPPHEPPQVRGKAPTG